MTIRVPTVGLPRILPAPSARRLVAALMVVAVLVLAACGDGDDTATDTTGDDTTTSDSDSTSSETSASTSSSASSSTDTSTSGPSTTTLPGEPFDGFAKEGDVLVVMGVAHDDVLNIREAPGTDRDVVATASPTANDLVATGEARSLPNSIWYEVTSGGTTGWASASFLAFEGPTDDVTSTFVGSDPLPETETMVEMGELVAEGFASDDPPSRIVQSVAPSVGDLGEVTYDVIGLGDDATAGLRLHVFATPAESGDGFVLKSIEATEFCGRGSTGDSCV